MLAEKKYASFKERGDLYLKSGDYDNAIKSYHEAILQGTNDFNTFYNLASIYKALNNNVKAEKFFKKALKIKDNDLYTLSDLASIYLSRGHIKKASTIIDRLGPIDQSLFKIFKQKLIN